MLDYDGAKALLGGTPDERIINYTYNEVLLFGVGSVVAGIIFPLRLLLSVWRMKNRGTV